MSKVFMVADLHFSHPNMAKHREFQDEFYHDEHIVDQWNSVVSKRDTVYILGDVTMESTQAYYRFDTMNGRKIVVLGNHHKWQDTPELLKYVDGVAGAIKYKGYMLTHIPIAEEELKFWRGNIYGHLHENDHVKNSDKRFCVSIDRLPKWRPIEFHKIIHEMSKLRKDGGL